MLAQQLHPIPPRQRGEPMPDERVKFTIRVDPDLAEKLRDASYWDRVPMNDMFIEAIKMRVAKKRWLLIISNHIHLLCIVNDRG